MGEALYEKQVECSHGVVLKKYKTFSGIKFTYTAPEVISGMFVRESGHLFIISSLNAELVFFLV